MKIEKGYTLIELLIVIAIIALFSGLSLAYYNNYTDDRKLAGETKQLVDVLNLAYKKATAVDLTPNSLCSDFRGYVVTFPFTPSTTYSLNFNCGGLNQLVSQYSINIGVVINSRTVNSILFKPLSAGTDLTSDPATITLKNSNISKCIDIWVHIVGTVEEGTKYSC